MHVPGTNNALCRVRTIDRLDANPAQMAKACSVQPTHHGSNWVLTGIYSYVFTPSQFICTYGIQNFSQIKVPYRVQHLLTIEPQQVHQAYDHEIKRKTGQRKSNVGSRSSPIHSFG
jgi:hypothetical protein